MGFNSKFKVLSKIESKQKKKYVWPVCVCVTAKQKAALQSVEMSVNTHPKHTPKTHTQKHGVILQKARL